MFNCIVSSPTDDAWRVLFSFNNIMPILRVWIYRKDLPLQKKKLYEEGTEKIGTYARPICIGIKRRKYEKLSRSG